MQGATLRITHSPHPPGNAAREGLLLPISQIRRLRFREAELPRVFRGALFTVLFSGSSLGLSLPGSPSRISRDWNGPEATKCVLSTWPSTREQACWEATCSGWGGLGSWQPRVRGQECGLSPEAGRAGGLSPCAKGGGHTLLSFWGLCLSRRGGVLRQGRDAPTSLVGGGLWGEGGGRLLMSTWGVAEPVGPLAGCDSPSTPPLALTTSPSSRTPGGPQP